ncbi:hypothetical protein HanRHA438_Chr12g0562901 [Helianthus annuus]|nr:hypothetical protein HanRHA438_Chr12g0562901 [Helianthus annuus]
MPSKTTISAPTKKTKHHSFLIMLNCTKSNSASNKKKNFFNLNFNKFSWFHLSLTAQN